MTATLLGTAAIAASSHVAFELPGTDVPQTAQTLVVLVVGAALGALRGATAVVAFLAVGLVGLPVFADGASGVDPLLGPTGGYLAGFVVGAVMAGAAVRPTSGDAPGRRAARLVAAMLVAHVAILACGWLRLAVELGAHDAYARGVAPFVAGGVAKSVVAAAVACVIETRRAARSERDEASSRSEPCA